MRSQWMLSSTATCTHDIFSVSIWSVMPAICKIHVNDFSFFSECAIYQPHFTEKNLVWSQLEYFANMLATCLHSELVFFSPGIEKFSCLLKNEEVMTPSGGLNNTDFSFLKNSPLFSIIMLFSFILQCERCGYYPHESEHPGSHSSFTVQRNARVLLHMTPAPLHRRPCSIRPSMQSVPGHVPHWTWHFEWLFILKSTKCFDFRGKGSMVESWHKTKWEFQSFFCC